MSKRPTIKDLKISDPEEQPAGWNPGTGDPIPVAARSPQEVETQPQLSKAAHAVASVGPESTSAVNRNVEPYSEAIARVAETQGQQPVVKLPFKDLADGGCEELAEVLKRKSIGALDISCNNIGLDGSFFISKALAANCSVTSLDISANAIGDDGATALARALNSNSNLKHLDVHACSIKDEGGASLARGLMSNSSLVAINLRANYIGDKGATALADSASKSTSLRFLVLAANDLTRSGEDALQRALRENPRLRLDMPRGENDNMLAEVGCTIA